MPLCFFRVRRLREGEKNGRQASEQKRKRERAERAPKRERARAPGGDRAALAFPPSRPPVRGHCCCCIGWQSSNSDRVPSHRVMRGPLTPVAERARHVLAFAVHKLPPVPPPDGSPASSSSPPPPRPPSSSLLPPTPHPLFTKNQHTQKTPSLTLKAPHTPHLLRPPLSRSCALNTQTRKDLICPKAKKKT